MVNINNGNSWFNQLVHFENEIVEAQATKVQNLWDLADTLTLNEAVNDAEFNSTRWGEQAWNYEFSVTNAQPDILDWDDKKWLWYREKFETALLDEEQQVEIISILRKAIETADEKHIREVIKTIFRFLWEQMWTWLNNEEITEVVNSLDSFKHPLIVPVEHLHDNLYLYDETQWPTDAFKDLALQQITKMVSLLTQRENNKSITKAVENKEQWVTYKFEENSEKLVKYINWEKAEDQEDRPKLTFLMSLTSTSWDTWPAWWSWIENEPWVWNAIFYPAFEATQWQAWQMNNLWWNVISYAIEEAFTEIQEMMKSSITPELVEKIRKIIEEKLKPIREEYGFDIELNLWSFNSVNIWRIDAQSIYHCVAGLNAKAQHPEIVWDIITSTPTWNFGHQFGQLQSKDIMWWKGDSIASMNENDAIYHLIEKWRYAMATSEFSSSSISMIIRYGSNVERLLRRTTWPERCSELMKKFETDGQLCEKLEKLKNSENEAGIQKIKDKLESVIIAYGENNWDWIEYIQGILNHMENYWDDNLDILRGLINAYQEESAWIQLTEDEHQAVKDEWLVAYRVTTEDELWTMREVFSKHKRLLCPHTANAYCAAQKYMLDNTETEQSIMISETSTPWKFLAAIATALECENKEEMYDTYKKYSKLEKTNEWKNELLVKIEAEYEKFGESFNIDLIPEDLREGYERDTNEDINVYPVKQIPELVLEHTKAWSWILSDEVNESVKETKKRLTKTV